jgi:hypothetical protein
MGESIRLRDDFDGASLRRLARTSKSANQARRLLALAEILTILLSCLMQRPWGGS